MLRGTGNFKPGMIVSTASAWLARYFVSRDAFLHFDLAHLRPRVAS